MPSIYADRLFRLCALLALVWIAVYLIPVLSASHEQLAVLVNAVYDDCYFYLAIAANIVDSGRSTLDGVTTTNGYQPMWLAILVVLAKLVGTDTITLLRATCVLISLIATLALALGLSGTRRDGRLAAASAGIGVAVIIVLARPVFLDGLETVLMLPCALPLMMLIERLRTPREDRLLSALLAFAFLVRLDALSLFVGVIVVGRLFPVGATRLDLRALFRLATFVVPTVFAFAFASWAVFGIPVPVSGLAKAVGGPSFSNWGIFQQFGSPWKTLGQWLLALGLVEWLALRASPDARFRRTIAVLLFATLLQRFYYAAFSVWQLFDWYFYLHYLAIAAIVARIAYLSAHLHVGGKRLVPFATGAVIVGMLLLADARQLRREFFPRKPSPDPVAEQRDLPHETGKVADVRLLNELFPKQAGGYLTVAMGDVSGALAYWGRDRLRVVELEGLTLDADYIRARRELRGNEYFDERFKIDYLVVDRGHIPLVASRDGDRQYAVADPIVGRVVLDPVPLFCFPESALVYRRVYIDGGIPFTRLAFRYPERAPCSPESLALIRDAEAGHGLRQLSLPYQYSRGYTDAAIEDRDRRLWK